MCNLVYHILECAHHPLNKTRTLRVPRGVKPGTASETFEKLSMSLLEKFVALSLDTVEGIPVIIPSCSMASQTCLADRDLKG